MYTRSLITFLLLALCALSTVLASPPAHPATDVLSVTSPKYYSVYRVGKPIPVKVTFVNGTENALYKANSEVRIIIQKNIRYPQLSTQVGSVRAQTLYKNGFSFLAKEEYLIKEQANVPFRVRVSFDYPGRFGFADSDSFKIVKK
ncbi:hypothetical protein BGX28_008709 [Mortierella sp. GBA30]|nr:hypothetical protein BGX28_008709 [Mortierella sp. GBA30]